LSGQFFQQSLFAAVDAIPGAIVTSHTHRNATSQQIYWRMINCGLTILIVSLFSLCRLRNTTQLRSGTVDKSKWPYFYKTHLATLPSSRTLPSKQRDCIWTSRTNLCVSPKSHICSQL